mmetsp:Transcript_12550/g.37706  ORF Transcript_12550/g.37706 Transcript_12550/m.37706 type:complete len:368 (-) Transcript_12550:667-1770(-)
MHVAVLHPAVVHQVLRERDLGAVEHAGLVHVVPDVEVLGGAGVVARQEVGAPPLPHLGVHHIQVRAGPRPAPPVIVLAIFVFDVVALVLSSLEDRVVRVTLDVGVHDGDDLATAAGNVVLHRLWVRESLTVPCQVPLAIRVFNVQPDDVVGDVVLVKAGIHRQSVCLVVVVPPALVVPEGEQLRHGCAAGDGSVLGRHRPRGGAHHQKQVQHAALRYPLRRHSAGGLAHVHVHFCSIQPEGTNREASPVGLHDRDRPVQPKVGLRQIFEHIQVVQPVRLVLLPFDAGGRLEGQPGGMLGEAVHVAGAWEGQVKADCLGTLRLGVCMRLEGLLPPTFGVPLLLLTQVLEGKHLVAVEVDGWLPINGHM